MSGTTRIGAYEILAPLGAGGSWGCAVLVAMMLQAWAMAAVQSSDPRRFEPEIQAFEAEDRAAPPPPGSVLFVGSSSIRYWDLDAAFPGRRAIKRGFGGSHVSDNLFYADRIIIPYRPALIVFYAGDADVAAGKTAEQIGADYRALVALLHGRLPGTRIVIIGTKPSPAHWAHMDTIRAANATARSMAAADPLVEYTDAEAVLLGTDGRPRADLFAENGLNLNARGYDAWTLALRPGIEPFWPAR
jgi:lysophospholipase L1-like esterase